MTSKTSRHTRGYIMIIASALLFGTYGIWSKVLGNDFGIFFQGWVRPIIVVLLMLPFMIKNKEFRRVPKKDLKWLTIPTLFALFTQVPLYYAYNTTSIGTAILIFYSVYVVVSYLVGWLILKEKMTKAKLWAMALAFAGLALVFGSSLAKFSLIGLLLAALNGIGSGGEVATTKKPTEKYSALFVSFWMWLIVGLVHLPISLLLGEKQIVPAFNYQWGALLAFALAGFGAMWLVVEGYKYVDASIGGLLGLSEIIWGIVFGVLFFAEKMNAMTVVGGVLILLAGMLPDGMALIKQKYFLKQ